MNKGLSVLVEKLRQEQEFVSFYKQQIRQSVQELNSSCDHIFHSLWLCHTLSYGLHRVLTHNSHTHEWSHALSQADAVKFVNASKGVKSHLFVDRYSKFLTQILNDPKLLSEILNHVESEGLDCSWVINDLMSVVYGHCMFRKDHTLYLELMRELLKQHIGRCDSPKDLFGGVETVFNHVLTEYCSQLIELRAFLTLVLHDPLMQVLACEDYLEFDVTKAGSRFQHNSSQNGLVGSNAFLFNEDLDLSCDKLAKLSSQFLQNLVSMSAHFPISLRWLLSNLKTMVKQKWPSISPADLRRPVSDAIFSSILSTAIVNPDSFGVVDPSLIIGEVGRYNLSQIMSVLQGCVWIMGKPTSSKYPIQKVVRRMDMNLFFSLVDSIDSGLSEEMPDLPSFLPGVHRSAFLASHEQLDNLVGLVAMLVTNREGKGKFHSSLSNLLSCLLPAMIEQASRNPYPITTKSAIFFSPPPTSASEQLDKNKSLSKKKPSKKFGVGGSMEMLDAGGTMGQRGRGVSTLQITPDGKAKFTAAEKHLKRSQSSEAGFSVAPSGFRLPEEVLVLPVLEKVEEETGQWDFYLLTEEEFMGQKCPSPGPKSEDLSYFNSFLRSQSAPRTLDLSTPPVMAAGLRNNEQAEEQVTAMMKYNFAARGRVMTMVSAIERGERGRANTLPTSIPSNTSQSFHTNPALSTGCSPVQKGLFFNGKMKLGRSTSHDETPHQNGSDEVERSPHISKGLPQSPVSTHILTEPRKLSTTFEVSMEESVSYVKLRPPTIENSSPGVPEEEEQEGEGKGEGEKRKESRTEEVFVCLESRDTDDDIVEESGDDIDTSELDLSGERVNSKSSNSLLDGSGESPQADEGQSDSLVNLYHVEEEGSPQVGGKLKKKRKWKFFRNKRKSMEVQESKVERSQSDAPFKSEGAGGVSGALQEVILRDKMRSVSDNTMISTGLGRRKVDRYTKFMEHYSNKLEETKKLSPNHQEEERSTSQGSGIEEVDRGSTNDMLDRGDATPPAEMTPLTFKHSLFCKQLKYKLRSALQNVHIPLTLSNALNPAFQQHQMGEELSFDARYQLIVLIQHVLQRSQWKQDDMEAALLKEILRLVEPLPSDLIQVTIDGVLESYHLRSSYIAYLVCSQQKFQDAKIQVAAMQESIQRIMQINTELFVNFAVRTFLEAPGQFRQQQLNTFSHQMETLFLADEKCSLMNQCLSDFKMVLNGDSLTWDHWQDQDSVASALDNYLFTSMYHHIFYPNGPTDTEVDKIFFDHLSTLSKTITLTHQSLQIPLVYHSGCPWVAAQKQLKIMAAYKSPQGKLHCIVQSLRILISLLQYARCGDPPGADDLFPVLVYVLIKANPPAMLSTCQYIRNFAESLLQGEDAYWWAQFSTAIEFTKTLS